jgi:DNA repair protein RadD
VSDFTPEHAAMLDQLGIGPNSAPRQRRKRPLHLVETLFRVAPEPLPALAEMSLTPLYGYQQKALEEVFAAIEAGERRVMLMLPTGGGKTVLAAHIFARMAQQGKVSAFPVPMITLASQSYDRFAQYGLTSLGIIQAKNRRTKRNAALQICSIATLAARRNQGKRELDNLGLVIVDEAHIKSAEIFQLMAEWSDVVFIGLSATPWSKGLGLHWKKLIICETSPA